MKYEYLTEEACIAFIEAALAEDIQDGDHSTLATVPDKMGEKASMMVKSDGIIAGLDLAKLIFSYVDDQLEVELFNQDGDQVERGQVALYVKGKAASILTAERLVLNCAQRMSGIATYTNRMVKLIEGTNAKILDTRKTTPNFRLLEKWAVKIGGGTNHRYGLFDMVMLKDNHIDFAGGITKAVGDTVAYLKKHNLDLRIEVETRNFNEVREAAETGHVDVIMLDNMSPERMKKAIDIIDGRCQSEASGGITEKSLRAVAETGVDFISMGALTHSAGILDISLNAF
ncbi:carboxylating nicotinate-nucleotide diphosphorylase [Flammeovirgaceae bacterium SG7u.111]|nr:carboxylating nicotinate-nucleotide diphosphorylase [Flammeovirgaceae bacterium SG7u.132]WPO36222.1 carboxylating nicotinate-nucleotide diphosphorylase [Flammeovirgaceae bacterium SG7u.111]